MIDILNIEPNVVSVNIRDYIIMVYGEPGVGKTTLFHEESTLFLSADLNGTKALAGSKAANLKDWTDALTVKQQLFNPKAREMYKTIVIDTVDDFLFILERSILEKKAVNDLRDIPWGQGHEMLKKQLKTFLRDLTIYYQVVLISHNKKSTVGEGETAYEKSDVSIKNSLKTLTLGICDFVLYIDQNEDSTRYIQWRRDQFAYCKSRFQDVPQKTPLSYEVIQQVIKKAGEQESLRNSDGAVIEKKEVVEEKEISTEDFEALKEAVSVKANELATAGNTMVVDLVKEVMGDIRISNATHPRDVKKIQYLNEQLNNL